MVQASDLTNIKSYLEDQKHHDIEEKLAPTDIYDLYIMKWKYLS